jgi:hypothetical protein
MNYTLRSAGVIQRDDGVFIPADPNNTDYAAYLEWTSAGNTATAQAPTAAQQQSALVAAVQAILDTKAQSYGYDDIASAVTYADEPSVPKFQAENQAFRAWRSLVWEAAYGYLAKVEAGTEQFPATDQIPSLLPTFTPPATTS